MSVQAFAMVPNRAVSDQNLGHAAFRLLSLIAVYRNSKTGWAFPGLKTLAVDMGYKPETGEAQISKMVKELREAGYIDHISGGGRKPSKYRVIYDAPPPSDEDVERESPDTTLDDFGNPPLGNLPRNTLVETHKGTRRLNQTTEQEEKEVLRTSKMRGLFEDDEPEEPQRVMISLGRKVAKPEQNRIAIVTSMAETWNQIAGDRLGKIMKMTNPRAQRLQAIRFAEFGGNVDGWEHFCRRVVGSNFLTGAGPQGWIADFDWVIKPANFVKIMEGKYDNSRLGGGAQSGNPFVAIAKEIYDERNKPPFFNNQNLPNHKIFGISNK